MAWLVPASAALALLLLAVRVAFQLRARSLLRPRLSLYGSSASTENVASLSVLTQNLWLHHFVAAPFRSLRIRAFLEHLAQQRPPIDIVVIQEAFLLRLGPVVLYEYVLELVQGMDRLGYHWWSDMEASLPFIFGQNSGVIVFSRLPIAVPPHEEVFAHSDEVLNSKGFACLKLALPSATLAIIGTHLDSRVLATQQQQMAQLASYLKGVTGERSAVIVAGDFNTCPRSWGAIVPGSNVTTSYATLCDYLRPLVNAVERQNDAQWLRTYYITPPRRTLFLQQVFGSLVQARWPNELSEESLDHVFFTPEVLRSTEVAAARWEAPSIHAPVSDHVGVLARFAL